MIDKKKYHHHDARERTDHVRDTIERGERGRRSEAAAYRYLKFTFPRLAAGPGSFDKARGIKFRGMQLVEIVFSVAVTARWLDSVGSEGR